MVNKMSHLTEDNIKLNHIIIILIHYKDIQVTIPNHNRNYKHNHKTTLTVPVLGSQS